MGCPSTIPSRYVLQWMSGKHNVNQIIQLLTFGKTVVLLGDLNYRMRMHPAEVLSRVQESSQSCKTIYEIERQQKRERAEWSWRRESYSRLWRPVDMNEKVIFFPKKMSIMYKGIKKLYTSQYRVLSQIAT